MGKKGKYVMEKCFVCEEKVGPTGISSYNFAVGCPCNQNMPDNKRFAFHGFIEDQNGNEICLCKNCFVNSFGYVLMELNESLSAINEDTLQ